MSGGEGGTLPIPVCCITHITRVKGYGVSTFLFQIKICILTQTVPIKGVGLAKISPIKDIIFSYMNEFPNSTVVAHQM